MGRSRNAQHITFSAVHDIGYLVTVWCNYCRTERHYHPADLLQLFGDIPADSFTRGSPCEVCHRRDYLHTKIWRPTAAEAITIMLRRLDRVELRRHVIWREEKMT